MHRLATLVSALLLVGCGGRPLEESAPARQVRVETLGGQCVRVTSSIGTSLLTNPFNPGTTGRTLPSPLKPDIILVSQERPEANNVDAVDNQPTIFRGSMGIGINSAMGIRIRGVPIFRNPDVQSVDGMNLVYTWTMDGVKFCHLGWLRAPLNSYSLSQIGLVDVLFVPVQGDLSASERDAIVGQIRPRVVVPMGKGWSYGNVQSVGSSSFSFSREMLPLQTTTLAFD